MDRSLVDCSRRSKAARTKGVSSARRGRPWRGARRSRRSAARQPSLPGRDASAPLPGWHEHPPRDSTGRREHPAGEGHSPSMGRRHSRRRSPGDHRRARPGRSDAALPRLPLAAAGDGREWPAEADPLGAARALRSRGRSGETRDLAGSVAPDRALAKAVADYPVPAAGSTPATTGIEASGASGAIGPSHGHRRGRAQAPRESRLHRLRRPTDRRARERSPRRRDDSSVRRVGQRLARLRQRRLWNCLAALSPHPERRSRESDGGGPDGGRGVVPRQGPCRARSLRARGANRPGVDRSAPLPRAAPSQGGATGARGAELRAGPGGAAGSARGPRRSRRHPRRAGTAVGGRGPLRARHRPLGRTGPLLAEFGRARMAMGETPAAIVALESARERLGRRFPPGSRARRSLSRRESHRRGPRRARSRATVTPGLSDGALQTRPGERPARRTGPRRPHPRRARTRRRDDPAARPARAPLRGGARRGSAKGTGQRKGPRRPRRGRGPRNWLLQDRTRTRNAARAGTGADRRTSAAGRSSRC